MDIKFSIPRRYHCGHFYHPLVILLKYYKMHRGSNLIVAFSHSLWTSKPRNPAPCYTIPVIDFSANWLTLRSSHTGIVLVTNKVHHHGGLLWGRIEFLFFSSKSTWSSAGWHTCVFSTCWQYPLQNDASTCGHLYSVTAFARYQCMIEKIPNKDTMENHKHLLPEIMCSDVTGTYLWIVSLHPPWRR